MAKGDYYFPLYYKRLLASTVGWKDDEFGAYVKLLIHQFDNGSIPHDLDELARIAPSVKKHWKLLAKKFHDDGNGGLINDVMDDIYHDIQDKKKINSDNGKKGGRKKRTVNRNETGRLPNGYENETEMKAIPIINNQQPINKSEEDPHTKISESWNTKPGAAEINLELPDLKGGAVIELFKFSKNIDVSAQQVRSLWKVFKSQNFNGEKFYQSPSEVYSHFINWCKTQTISVIKGSEKMNGSAGNYQEEKTKSILDGTYKPQ